jgi:hypothetical protein
MHLRPALALALLLVTALVAPTAATTGTVAGRSVAEPAPGPRGIIDADEVQVVCEGSELAGNGQLTGPDQLSTAHLLGTPERISLDVLVVLDLAEAVDVARIDRSTEAGEAAYQAAGDALFQRVVDLLEVAPQPYEPLGIDLVWAGWDLLEPLVDGAPRQRTTESQGIIDLARAQYDGARPDGADVVYVATDLDIQALGQTAVAGQADCIGGVGDPAHAFAVGEVGDALVHPKDGIPIGPVTFYRDFAAKVAAHEIGHLMGGHHHYQECATPAPVTTAVARTEVGACTLMSNAVDFQTLPFSTLNGAVVRGHAEAYATP